MKYIQFAIMAALVFGIAASPVLSNGFAFATSDGVGEGTESDKEQKASDKEQRASDKEQKASDKTKQESVKECNQDEEVTPECPRNVGWN